MSEKLRECPFCGGAGKPLKIAERFGYGEYERHPVYHVVRCEKCSSEGKRYEEKALIEFTSSTVADFRHNPVLRAKVEDEYEAYCAQTAELAVTAWNRRVPDPAPAEHVPERTLQEHLVKLRADPERSVSDDDDSYDPACMYNQGYHDALSKIDAWLGRGK